MWVKPWKKWLNLMLAGSFTTEGLGVSYHLLFPRKLTLTQWLLNNIEQKERKRESNEAIAQTRYKQTEKQRENKEVVLKVISAKYNTIR